MADRQGRRAAESAASSRDSRRRANPDAHSSSSNFALAACSVRERAGPSEAPDIASLSVVLGKSGHTGAGVSGSRVPASDQQVREAEQRGDASVTRVFCDRPHDSLDPDRYSGSLHVSQQGTRETVPAA